MIPGRAREGQWFQVPLKFVILVLDASRPETCLGLCRAQKILIGGTKPRRTEHRVDRYRYFAIQATKQFEDWGRWEPTTVYKPTSSHEIVLNHNQKDHVSREDSDMAERVFLRINLT